MLLRIKAGLRQEDLAEILGVTQKTISRWETGKSVPQLTIPQFKKLLQALGVTVEELPDDFGPQALENHTIGPASGFQS